MGQSDIRQSINTLDVQGKQAVTGQSIHTLQCIGQTDNGQSINTLECIGQSDTGQSKMLWSV